MTKDQKEFYDENGYVILEKIFTDNEADTFNRFIRRHANINFAALINPDRYDSLLEQDERPKSDITLKEIEETLKWRDQYDDKVSNLLIFFMKKVVGRSSQFIFTAYSIIALKRGKPR